MGLVTRGRIVSGEGATVPNPAPAAVDAQRGRIVPREVAAAHEEARRIIADAEERAARLLEGARAAALREREAHAAEIAAAGEAERAAYLLAFKREVDARAESDHERLATTAALLAERVLGAALELKPELVATLAAAALAEARGARKVVFEANPLDAAVLRAQLEGATLPGGAAVEDNPSLGRGDLIVRTNLGTLDARLKPQLERLAQALARAERSERR